MKRLILLLLLLTSAGLANERHNNQCRTDAGAISASCTVTVYDAGTVNLSTIYSDNITPPTAKANPFTASANGQFFFYAADGEYDIVLTAGTPSISTFTIGAQRIGPDATEDIGFTHTGTGATERALRTRLAEVFNVKDFGATGDGTTNDTAAIQAAMDAADGRPVFLPTGTYVVTSTLTRTISGAGAKAALKLYGDGMYKTIIDNRVASGPAIQLSHSAPVNDAFQWGGFIDDLTITTTTSPATSSGIRIRSTRNFRISSVRVAGLTDDGLEIGTQVGDADSVTFLTVERVLIETNGGNGINYDSPSGVLATSYVSVTDSIIQNNTGAGIRYQGIGLAVTNTVFNLNDGHGIYAPLNGVSPRNLFVATCSFELNSTAALNIESLLSGTFIGNSFIYADVGTPALFTHGFVLGDGGSGVIQRVTIERSRFRTEGTATTYIAYTLSAGTTNVIRIVDTHWEVFSAPRVRFVNNSTGSNTIIDDGRQLRPTPMEQTVVSTGTTPWTPVLADGPFQRLSVTTTSAFTINAPTGIEGQEMILAVANFAGGAVDVLFDSGFEIENFQNPASSQRTTARFVYDGTGAKWIQQGAWTRTNACTANYLLYSDGSRYTCDSSSTRGLVYDPSTNQMGIGITTPLFPLHVSGESGQSVPGAIAIDSSDQDATTRQGFLATSAYLLAQPAMAALFTQNLSAQNIIRIGGGSSSFQAATDITFYTAAAVNTTTGTGRAGLISDGSFWIGTVPVSPPALLTVAGTIKLDDQGTRPSCSVSTRFLIWPDAGGAGVADSFAVCLKNTSDVYAWIEKGAAVP